MRGEVWGVLTTSKLLLVAVSPTPRTVIPKVPCFPHRSCGESVEASKTTWTPKVCKNNGLYGCYYGFRAIMLHTFGV